LSVRIDKNGALRSVCNGSKGATSKHRNTTKTINKVNRGVD